MTIPIKYVLIGSLVLIIVTAACTHYFDPPKTIVTTQKEIQTVVQNHIITVTKEVDKPDGTKEVDTTVTDTTQKTGDTKLSKTDVTVSQPNWFVAGGIGAQGFDFAKPVYSGEIHRRILGPIYLGVRASTDASYGALIGVEF